MRKQSYYEYVFSRVEFALAVGLFMEFGYETKLRSEFDVTADWDTVKTQILPIRPAVKEIADPKYFDLCFETMRFAKEFRTSPVIIANKLKPYVEEYSFIDRVDITGGYMNIFFDRVSFFKTLVEIQYENISP